MVYVIPKYSKHTAGNCTTKYKLGIICPAGRIQFSKYYVDPHIMRVANR
jgi:hypothetical protein